MSTQCRFSACGRYLHIASLEADPGKKTRGPTKRGKGPEVSSFKMSAFVSTHQLSNRKTTRSPPTLVQGVKIALGISPMADAPIEVTWTDGQLYITSNLDSITVYRVALHNDPATKNVLVPRTPIVLEAFAKGMRMTYLPPKFPSSSAVLVLSGQKVSEASAPANSAEPEPDRNESLGNVEHSESTTGSEPSEETKKEQDGAFTTPAGVRELAYAKPPGIVYLDEAKDLGGWGFSTAEVAVRSGHRDGRLIRRLGIRSDDDCGC